MEKLKKLGQAILLLAVGALAGEQLGNKGFNTKVPCENIGEVE